jgi:hypothetical protein
LSDDIFKNDKLLFVLFFGINDLFISVEVAGKGFSEKNRDIFLTFVDDLFFNDCNHHIVLVLSVFGVDFFTSGAINNLSDEVQVAAHNVFHQGFDSFEISEDLFGKFFPVSETVHLKKVLTNFFMIGFDHVVVVVLEHGDFLVLRLMVDQHEESPWLALFFGFEASNVIKEFISD